MSGFDIVSVGDLIKLGEANLQTGPFGTQLKASEYVSEGVPVINVRNIGHGDIRDAKLEFLDEKTALRLDAHRLISEDIVFGRKGATDRHVFIKKENSGWIQGSDCLRLRINSKKVFPRYLSYYFTTKPHTDWMEALCSFGATMSSLNQDIVKRINFPAPPLPVQQKIAAILSVYDDLIENNNKRIALLEKAAEEIYREWFVRMRFPGWKQVKVVKGIPEGWQIMKVKEIVDRKRFGRIYREHELSQDGKVVIIDQSTKPFLGFYDGAPEHIATENNPIILFGDHSCKMELMVVPFSLAENVVPFTSMGDMPVIFLYYLIKGIIETTEYKRHWIELINKDVYVPSLNLQAQYSEIIKNHLVQINSLKEINRKIIKSRDMLLPRLISGKLSVEGLDIRFPESMS